MKITGTAEQGFQSLNADQPLFHGQRAQKIWLVVANSEKASIYNISKTAARKPYRKKTRGLDLDSEIVPDLELIANAVSDITPFAAGAQKNTSHIAAADGSVHYASDPRDRENHQDEKIFIKDLAAWLDRAEKERAFDKLIVAAAPRTQGNLREFMTANVKKRILSSLSKDLTAMAPAQMEHYLKTDFDLPLA